MDRQDPLVARVARRYAFKYEPKESKQHKVDRILKTIRDTTGISKGVAEDIADAIVRGRDVAALALQKGWPVEDTEVKGPKGSMDFAEIRALTNMKAAYTSVYDKSRDHLYDMASGLHRAQHETATLQKIVRDAAREYAGAADKVVMDSPVYGPKMHDLGVGLVHVGEQLKALQVQIEGLQAQAEQLKKEVR